MTTKRLNPRPKRKNSLLALILFLAVFSAVGVLAKDIYFYRDKKGVLHFTDAPTDVRFRPFTAKAKVRAGPRVTTRLGPDQVRPYIYSAARKYRLDPALIMAVIKVESAYDPHAVSWAGAQGLMQLIPDTAKLMEVRNAFDPKQNIMGGCRYLRMLLDRFDEDLKLSLAAYNIGPERVAREKKIPNVQETQAYVQQVMYHYARYKKEK